MWSSPVSLYAQGSESCTRPARRVVEKGVPLLDCTRARKEISSERSMRSARRVEENMDWAE